MWEQVPGVLPVQERSGRAGGPRPSQRSWKPECETTNGGLHGTTAPSGSTAAAPPAGRHPWPGHKVHDSADLGDRDCAVSCWAAGPRLFPGAARLGRWWLRGPFLDWTRSTGASHLGRERSDGGRHIAAPARATPRCVPVRGCPRRWWWRDFAWLGRSCGSAMTIITSRDARCGPLPSHDPAPGAPPHTAMSVQTPSKDMFPVQSCRPPTPRGHGICRQKPSGLTVRGCAKRLFGPLDSRSHRLLNSSPTRAASSGWVPVGALALLASARSGRCLVGPSSRSITRRGCARPPARSLVGE